MTGLPRGELTRGWDSGPALSCEDSVPGGFFGGDSLWRRGAVTAICVEGGMERGAEGQSAGVVPAQSPHALSQGGCWMGKP